MPAVCLHCGEQQSHLFGITVLIPYKRPLLEGSPKGISQLTTMLCNHYVQGEEGNEIQTQQEPVICISLTGQDHSHNSHTGKSPGLELQQIAHPIHQSIFNPVAGRVWLGLTSLWLASS